MIGTGRGAGVTPDGEFAVAVTVEQCWHRVPGGTAGAVIGWLGALPTERDVRVVGVAARHRQLPDEPFVPPVPVASLALPRVLLYESWHRRRRPAVQRATGPVDVIHATGMAVPPRTAPLVVTVNDLAFLHEPDHFSARGLRFFRRSLELTRDEADLIICPSEATAADCTQVGLDPERIRVVPLGVDATVAPEADIDRVRCRYGLPGRFVLWVGTVEPRKNLPALVAAWRDLRRDDDVGLVLVGPGGWREDLDDRLGEDRDGVVVTGFVPADDLRALYAAATVFCYPSLREGFGLPVLEAMAQGTPVVTSVGTSTAEVLGDDGGAGRLADPQDPASVAAALREVVGDDDVARTMGAAGRRRALSFGWDRTAAGTIEVWRSAAAGAVR